MKNKTLGDDCLGVYIGIDVGGTSMKGAMVTREGEILLELSTRTPIEQGREGIIRELTGLVISLIQRSDRLVLGIGVGSAGAIDPVTGTVSYATDNLPGWTDTPLTELLSERTGLMVVADNDAHAAALGESWIGAAQSYKSFAFAAIGTGVGGALVSREEIIHGNRGIAGEIGHMILYPGGLPCNCGQKGCLEQYASGTALNRIAKEIECDWTSHRLMQQYADRDTRAVEAVNRFINDLATGLVSLHNMFGPEAIIIGGGLIEAADLWWDQLEPAISQITSKPVITIKAKLGNRAGIIGAAYLAKVKREMESDA